MGLVNKIKNFINKYSARQTWNAIVNGLQSLIEAIKESIENTGSSFIKFLLVLFLILLISIQSIGLFFKNILKNIFKLLNKIFDFLLDTLTWLWEWIVSLLENLLTFIKRVWFFIWDYLLVPLIEEVGFYFKVLAEVTDGLKGSLSTLLGKLYEFSGFLSKKFTEDSLPYNSKINESFISLFGDSLFKIVVVIIALIVALSMTLILGVGAIVCLPFLHQFIRKEIFGKNENGVFAYVVLAVSLISLIFMLWYKWNNLNEFLTENDAKNDMKIEAHPKPNILNPETNDEEKLENTSKEAVNVVNVKDFQQQIVKKYLNGIDSKKWKSIENLFVLDGINFYGKNYSKNELKEFLDRVWRKVLYEKNELISSTFKSVKSGKGYKITFESKYNGKYNDNTEKSFKVIYQIILNENGKIVSVTSKKI